MIKKIIQTVQKIKKEKVLATYKEHLKVILPKDYPFNKVFKNAHWYLNNSFENLLIEGIQQKQKSFIDYILKTYPQEVKNLTQKNHFFLWHALWANDVDYIYNFGQKLLKAGFNINNFSQSQTEDFNHKRHVLNDFISGTIADFFVYQIFEEMKRLSPYRDKEKREFEGLLGHTVKKEDVMQKFAFFFANCGDFDHTVGNVSVEKTFKQTSSQPAIFAVLEIQDAEIRNFILKNMKKKDVFIAIKDFMHILYPFHIQNHQEYIDKICAVTTTEEKLSFKNDIQEFYLDLKNVHKNNTADLKEFLEFKNYLDSKIEESLLIGIRTKIQSKKTKML